MHKILLGIFVFCLLAASNATAQTRSRVFDNFDTVKGVQVVTPAAVVPIVATKNSKKQVKKTVQQQQTMNVEDGLSLKNNVQKTSSIVSTKLLMASGNNLSGFTTGDAVIDSYIVDSSKRYGIDPLLIYAQMHQESGFKLKATSYKGASGLMQLMPATAIRFGVTSIYDPKQNIDAGVKYMRWLLDKFGGDVALALAGYNAGEGAVMKYGYQIPPYRETQEYVRRISARYNSISNPNVAKTVRKVSTTQAAKLEKKETAPLTVYEPNALAIKMPDGRMRLVNQ
jgi:soluble lytic murein transglycosylase-like protein